MKAWLMGEGRLSRGAFWLSTLVLWAVFYGLWEGLALPVNAATVLLLNGPVLWLLGALSVRRLHDRSRSAWALLWVLLPVLGAAWLFWQLALRGSDPQENPWGLPPQAVTGDFLVVR